MKNKEKYWRLVSLFLIIVSLSCSKYEDYEIQTVRSTVYFSYQRPVRTLIAESNSLSFEVGVMLGGKRDNTIDELVTFKVEPALLQDQGLMGDKTFKILPTSYYSLSNDSQIVIPKGSFQGGVTITLNQNFVNDPESLTSTYILPLVINSSTTETILTGEGGETARKDYTLIVIKYISQYHATYYHRGFMYSFDASGNPLDTVQYVRAEEETQYMKNHVWNLSTRSSNELITDGLAFFTSQNNQRYSMKLLVNGDGKVDISNDPNSLVNNVISNGDSRYDADKKQFYLFYEYKDVDNITYKMRDTLIFRNVDLKLEQW